MNDKHIDASPAEATPEVAPDASQEAPGVSLSVSFCEAASPDSTVDDLEALLAATCAEAGFPYCERVYVGSYFCENFFLGLDDGFHGAVRELCARYDMAATLVVPIIGQAYLERTSARLAELLGKFADVYDEVVANDVATFHDLLAWQGAGPHSFGSEARGGAATSRFSLGLGRLFAKELRDARYAEMLGKTTCPQLSAEAEECLATQRGAFPASRTIVEVDPTSAVVDVSDLARRAHELAGGEAEIAMHLPLCYATTGRNCGPASADEPLSRKFQLGQGCSRHCLRMRQGYLTDEGAHYLKHGRAYYYENPSCKIAGVPSWRIVYAAVHETMR